MTTLQYLDGILPIALKLLDEVGVDLLGLNVFNIRILYPIAIIWCQRKESNPRPAHYECAALPTELRWLI